MAQPKKKHWIKKTISYVIVIILVLIGLGLVFNSQVESFWLGLQTHQKVSKISSNEVKKGEKSKADFKYDNVKSVSQNALVQSEKAKKTDAIGKISIPSLDIDLPIFKGLNSDSLTIGAGTMKPNQKMGKGNYTLAGHHMQDPDVLFSPLAKAKKGQKVYLNNAKHTYKYKITNVKVVPETDIDVINDVPGKKLLTLVTCASGNAGETKRIIVTGKLIK